MVEEPESPARGEADRRASLRAWIVVLLAALVLDGGAVALEMIHRAEVMHEVGHMRTS